MTILDKVLHRIADAASHIADKTAGRSEDSETKSSEIRIRPNSMLGVGYRPLNRTSIERKQEDRKQKRGAKNGRVPPMNRIDTSFIKSIGGILSAADKNPDEILAEQGVNVYDEMEAKDAHVYSVYQTRKLAISLIPWEILAADKSKRQEEIAEFVFTAIEDARGPFSEDIKQLADAIGKGFSILEIVWRYIDKGKWKGKYGIEELVFHKQKYWFFADRRWHKSDRNVAFFGADRSNTKEVPWEKIIHYAFNSQDNMYGRAAFQPCFWFSWFKREGWKSWIIFLNKYGSPIAKGVYPPGTPENLQDDLMTALESIQEETALIHSSDFTSSFLEPSHTAAASFKELNDSCNAEISKAILGATQTVEEGKRGSYALSKAHSEVRRERIDADAVDVCDVIQEQLVKRLVDFNFVTDKYPQFVMRRVAGKETPPPGSGHLVVSEVEPVPEQTPSDALPEETTAVPEITPPSPEETAIPTDTTPTLGPDVVLSSEIDYAFEDVRRLAVKKSEQKGHPVVNVRSIKLLLSRKVGSDRAHDLAGRAKSYIERRISKANIDEVLEDAKEFLYEELRRETGR